MRQVIVDKPIWNGNLIFSLKSSTFHNCALPISFVQLFIIVWTVSSKTICFGENFTIVLTYQNRFFYMLQRYEIVTLLPGRLKRHRNSENFLQFFRNFSTFLQLFCLYYKTEEVHAQCIEFRRWFIHFYIHNQIGTMITNTRFFMKLFHLKSFFSVLNVMIVDNVDYCVQKYNSKIDFFLFSRTKVEWKC